MPDLEEELQTFYDKTKQLRKNFPARLDFQVDENLKKYIQDWQRKLKDIYDEVLGKIEHLPDDPNYQEVDSMLETMNNFFNHLETLGSASPSYYIKPNDRVLAAKAVKDELEELKKDPAVKAILTFGQECSKLYSAANINKYMEMEKKQAVEAGEKLKTRKQALTEQYNTQVKKYEKQGSHFTAWLTASSFLVVTFPLAIYFGVKAHKTSKELRALSKELTSLEPKHFYQKKHPDLQVDLELKNRDQAELKTMKEGLRTLAGETRKSLEGEKARRQIKPGKNS